MNTKPVLAAAGGFLLLCAAVYAAASKSATRRPSVDSVERGRYLVHQVAMCIDCHSPRGRDGKFIEEQHLAGAPLAFAATVPMPWAPLAPRLAGIPAGYDAEALVAFLMTGERPNGLPPTLPPMPAVRLDRTDSEAIAAYLASLKP